jgi:hypothetical protein
MKHGAQTSVRSAVNDLPPLPSSNFRRWIFVGYLRHEIP